MIWPEIVGVRHLPQDNPAKRRPARIAYGRRHPPGVREDRSRYHGPGRLQRTCQPGLSAHRLPERNQCGFQPIDSTKARSAHAVCRTVSNRTGPTQRIKAACSVPSSPRSRVRGNHSAGLWPEQGFQPVTTKPPPLGGGPDNSGPPGGSGTFSRCQRQASKAVPDLDHLQGASQQPHQDRAGGASGFGI